VRTYGSDAHAPRVSAHGRGGGARKRGSSAHARLRIKTLFLRARAAHPMTASDLGAADPYGAPRNHRKISAMLALCEMGGSGHYAPGTRKCSVCQEFKTKKDFNAEEAAKPASKRCCYACGAASGLLPKDLTKLTVVKLKEELQKRGLDTKGLKAALVSRLQKVVSAEEPKARPPSAPTPKKAPKPSQKIPPQAHGYVFDFGQHVGKSLAHVWAQDPSYVRWMLAEGVYTTSMQPCTIPLRDAGPSPLSSPDRRPNPFACPRGGVQLRRRRYHSR
jgi:hypothetical protein